MGKIKQFGRNLSLRKGIVLYIITFAVLAILLIIITSVVCGNIIIALKDTYQLPGRTLSKQDSTLIEFLKLFPVFTTPVYSALCIIAAALLFYRNKLKKPLSELKAASEKISNNDLDFQVSYQSLDELGQLCASFETMRSTLENNFSEMWRQMEERKQLNAAFAHDLRTPLTVLKGYDEILQTSNDPITKDTAVTMGKHISRLEQYVDSMSHLHRLEDAQPQYDNSNIQSHITDLIESAIIFCEQKGKNLCVEKNTIDTSLCVDWSFVSQVSFNLISNATRYAQSNIKLACSIAIDGFILSVSDDGKGFAQDILHKAVNPYFTGEENHAEHFGLGLYICKILCENHSGYLKIENQSTGAKVTAFFKSLAL